jgi:hypothetical protein
MRLPALLQDIVQVRARVVGENVGDFDEAQ